MPLNFIERAKRRNETYNRFLRETNITRMEEGSKSRSLIDSILSYQETIEDLMADEITRVNPLSAQSLYLDYWLTFLNIQKLPPSKVVVTAEQKIVKLYVDGATFGDLNNGSAINIGVGELVLTGRSRAFDDGQITEQDLTYVNTEPITLLSGDNEAFISIESSGYGEVYRLEKGQLQTHSFQDYPTFGSLDLLVTNVLPITSGYDGDSDELLGTKLFRSSFFTGFDIEDKIRNLLSEIPDVEDYKILPRFSGPGTIDVFVDNSFFTIDEVILNTVRERLEAIQNKGTQVFVSKVPRVGITIVLTLDFIPSLVYEEKIAICDQVRNLIYNNLSVRQIGEEFNFIELANLIKSNYSQILSFGRSNQYFDEVKIYKTGLFSERIGAFHDQNNVLETKEYERIFPETTFPNPIIVRPKNA